MPDDQVSLGISAPVGFGGNNRTLDVLVIQHLLARHAGLTTPPLPGPLRAGLCGARTLRAIFEFQRQVMGFRRPDMLVDTKGPTLAALNRPPPKAASPRAVIGTRPATGNTPLLDDAQVTRELYAHLREREGVYPHFYCDNASPRKLVTIGIGHLVDRRHAGVGDGRRLVTALVNGLGLRFTHAGGGGGADLEEVLEDWKRVRAYGAALGRQRPARHYAKVAKLRITAASAEQLMRQKIARHMKQMYTRRPFVVRLDPYIQAALVDARFNPAGVALYDMVDNPGDHFHRNMPKLWAALDPDAETFDLREATRLFDRTWATRGKRERYRERHRKRVAFFRSGVARMVPTALD